MSELAVKVLTLAFHPSTNENEAVCAFLKARAMVPKNPDYNGFLRSGQNASATKVVYVKTETKKHCSWKLTISVKKIPRLFSILKCYSDTPYYTIENLSDSWNAIGTVKLNLSIFLSPIEFIAFEKYFDKTFDAHIINN